MFGGESAHPFADRQQLFGRRHAGWISAGVTLSLNELQAADPHHREFVQVRRCDREKLQSLEQGNRRGLSFTQNSLIEFQPTEFAIEKTSFSSHASQSSFETHVESFGVTANDLAQVMTNSRILANSSTRIPPQSYGLLSYDAHPPAVTASVIDISVRVYRSVMVFVNYQCG